MLFIVWISCFRILGFYASGFVMIVISLDRLSAIMFPISHRSNTKRIKAMLFIAWLMALLCSLPRSYFFTVQRHPLVPEYLQCTPIGSYPSKNFVSISLSLCSSVSFIFLEVTLESALQNWTWANKPAAFGFILGIQPCNLWISIPIWS